MVNILFKNQTQRILFALDCYKIRIKGISISTILFACTNLLSAQTCVNLPPIDGVPSPISAPAGWSFWFFTPDLIAGNGPYPVTGAYDISDVDGASIQGGEMELMIKYLTNNGEGMQTTVNGLTVGQSYVVNLEWQQCKLSNSAQEFAFGDLEIEVDGVSSFFSSNGGVNDLWQIATVSFVATSTNSTIKVQVVEAASGQIGSHGCAIVVDDIQCSSMSFGAGQDQIICEGDSVILSATGAASYTWNNNVINGVSFVPPVGVTTYTVTGYDNAGTAIGTDDVDVTVHPNPTVNAGPDQTICSGNLVTLTGSGAPTLNWDNGVTDGTPFTPISTTQYILTGTSIDGCTDSDTVLVTVLPLPTPSITGNLDYCQGESVSLDAGGGYSDYSWSTGSTTQNSSGLTTANNPITVTVTNANGCTGTSAPVNVMEHALPLVDLGTGLFFCEGDSVMLDAANSGANYLWSTTSTSQTIYVSSAGSYHVQVTSAMGCVNADTVEVTEAPLPDVNAGPDQAICFGEEVTLVGMGSGTISWSDGVEDNVAFAPTQTGVYTLTITDANNCVNTDEVLVEVMDLPDASFTYSPQEIELSDSEVTFANTTINGSIYHWTFGEGGSSNEEHPVYLYEEPGTYNIILVATSDFGCMDTAYATLEVIDVPYFYVPNSFSPNGDGVNDLFAPVLSGRLPSKYELLIFNRWGEVIYQTDDYTQTWGGKYQSVDCPIDSYVWLVRMVDKDGVSAKELTGHLNLVR